MTIKPESVTTPEEMMEWLAIQIHDRKGTDLDPSPYLDMLKAIREFIKENSYPYTLRASDV